MHKLAIAVVLCGGMGLGLAIGSSGQSQAALLIKAPHKNMSLIQEAKKKSRSSCWDFFCERCCTNQTTGKETCIAICK
jgi:hypothetical protein